MILVNLRSLSVRTQPLNTFRRSISSTKWWSAKETLEEKSNSSDIETYKTERLTEDAIQKITHVDNINIVTKYQKKKPQRPPLLLEFFINRIDREMLTYPQVMNEVKDFEEMAERLKPATNYFANNANASADLRFRDVSNQMLADFRYMKLFGANVLEKYGGRGYFKSEMAWASESEANDIKSYLILAGHRLAVEAITEHGTESQQNQYLMEMAKGEIIAATCLNDPLAESGTITVSKTSTPYGDEYILNGSATWTICSQHANHLVVVAKKSESLLAAEAEGDYEEDVDYDDPSLTIMLDAKSNGITYEDQNRPIGCEDVPFSTVNLFNVRVPKSQILFQIYDERHLSEKLIENHRLQIAVLNMVQAKKITNKIIEYIISTKSCEAKLREQQFIQSTLAKIAMEIYALESMIYLSTGIIDDYDNPKVDLESAVTKAFSQDILKNLLECALALDAKSFSIENELTQRDLLNALQLQTLGGTSDALEKYVATKGIERCVDHYGKNTDDFKDSFLLKLSLTDPTIESIRANRRLGDFLHPSFEESADNLEESITCMNSAAQMLLSRYQEDTLSQRNDLKNLGEMAMHNFAMFAGIARASRGYCLGLRFGQYETVAAANLIFPTACKIQEMALDIKHERNGIQESQQSVIDSTIDMFRKKMSPFNSIRQIGLMAKQSK